MERSLTLIAYVVLGMIGVGLLVNYAINALGPVQPPVINFTPDDRGVIVPPPELPACTAAACAASDPAPDDCEFPGCVEGACVLDALRRGAGTPCKTALGVDGVCDAVGECLSLPCEDDRDNTTVCVGWVCGSRRDACDVLRSCGACAGADACVDGVCTPPPAPITGLRETARTRLDLVASVHYDSDPFPNHGVSGLETGLRVDGQYLMTDEMVPRFNPGCGLGAACTVKTKSSDGSDLRIFFDPHAVRFSLVSPEAPTRVGSAMRITPDCHQKGVHASYLAFTAVAFSPDGKFIAGLSNIGDLLGYTTERMFYCCDARCESDPPRFQFPHNPATIGAGGLPLGIREIGGRTLLVLLGRGGSVVDVTALKSASVAPDAEGHINLPAPSAGLRNFGPTGLAAAGHSAILIGERVISLVSDGSSAPVLTVYGLRDAAAITSIALPESAKTVPSFRLASIDAGDDTIVFAYGVSSSGTNVLYAYRVEQAALVPMAQGAVLPAIIELTGWRVDGTLGIIIVSSDGTHAYLLDDLAAGVVDDVYVGDGASPPLASYIVGDTTYVYAKGSWEAPCASAADGTIGTCLDENIEVLTFGPDALRR